MKIIQTLCALAAASFCIGAAGADKVVLDKQALRLLDASGRERARVPVRAKQLHVRGDLAVVLDSATQHVQAFRVDATLTPLPPLPVRAFGVESLCLFRDRQGLTFLFIAARDGQAEQWLMQGDTPRLVRKLSLPPDPGPCTVDDARHAMYVDEEGVGRWAYEADSEAMPSRVLLKGRARAAAVAPALPVLMARAQTETVAQFGDVADDPAIWVHPSDPAQARVLGTNKKQGLAVYDLQGRQRQFLASGRLNNVDLRQGVRFGGAAYDLAVASQRDDNTVLLYAIDGAGLVSEAARLPTGLSEIYGICLFQPRAGGLDVIVNDKDGRFRQYALARADGVWRATLAREFRLASQPEGCVADDANERLFIGEEKRGVWTLPARAALAPRRSLVLGVGRDLKADVEGMALYRGKWLIVSSQGDSSYVVLDAAPPYKLRGRFKVGMNVAEGIDGTADTDGLDVTDKPLGAAYPQGMLVIQDGYKRLPDGPQNFKYLSWEDVARALDL